MSEIRILKRKPISLNFSTTDSNVVLVLCRVRKQDCGQHKIVEEI